jgi:hypothetical protein
LLFPVLTGKNSPTYTAANSSTLSAAKSPPPEPPPDLAPVAASPPPLASDKENRPAVAAGASVKPAQPNDASATRQPPVPQVEKAKQINVAENGIPQTNVVSGVTVASAPSATMPIYKTESVAADSFGNAPTANKDLSDRALRPTPPPVATAPHSAAAPALAQSSQLKKSETQKQPSYAVTSASAYSVAKFQAPAELPAASQLFNRLDAPADEKRALGLLSAPAPVLVSFRLEQNGSKLRVVDADGSVYTGAVQLAEEATPPAAVVAASPKNRAAAAPPANAAAESSVQNYFFRVAGTNRNLNQNVVFSGNLIPLTNTPFPPSNAGAIGGALRTGRRAPVAPEPSIFSNSRISGRAVIGTDKEIEVNATPAP